MYVLSLSICSNPPVQGLALQYGSLPLLSHLLSLSEPEFVQRRALFALGALLRGNIVEQIRFIKVYRGLEILGAHFRKRSIQVQTKAVVLLTDFLDAEVEALGPLARACSLVPRPSAPLHHIILGEGERKAWG